MQRYGTWTVTVKQYIEETRRHAGEIGRMVWAAPMDWMSEPVVRHGGRLRQTHFKGTGLSIAEHRRRTVLNYLELCDAAPDFPWIPVLQGWTLDDYFRCVELYDRMGVDLSKCPVVGLGSVCRRNAVTDIEYIVRGVASLGISLHGFGVKSESLWLCKGALVSADSMAWSFDARYADPLPGCTHKNCANCYPYALRWRKKVLNQMQVPRRPILSHGFFT